MVPQAPPAPGDGTWGHQPQSSGPALGVQAAFVEKEGEVWLLPWLFAQFCPAAWFHGGDACRACDTLIAQLVNGEQHVLGFASHLSVLQVCVEG